VTCILSSIVLLFLFLLFFTACLGEPRGCISTPSSNCTMFSCGERKLTLANRDLSHSGSVTNNAGLDTLTFIHVRSIQM